MIPATYNSRRPQSNVTGGDDFEMIFDVRTAFDLELDRFIRGLKLEHQKAMRARRAAEAQLRSWRRQPRWSRTEKRPALCLGARARDKLTTPARRWAETEVER